MPRQIVFACVAATSKPDQLSSDILVNYFLMPQLADFSGQYPDIELTLHISYDVFDLSRREADVAMQEHVLTLRSTPSFWKRSTASGRGAG